MPSSLPKSFAPTLREVPVGTTGAPAAPSRARRGGAFSASLGGKVPSTPPSTNRAGPLPSASNNSNNIATSNNINSSSNKSSSSNNNSSSNNASSSGGISRPKLSSGVQAPKAAMTRPSGLGGKGGAAAAAAKAAAGGGAAAKGGKGAAASGGPPVRGSLASAISGGTTFRPSQSFRSTGKGAGKPSGPSGRAW
mmetsp:Transcript_80642/g.168144  ORF Transcript_80642/g.168144 Transcript_80642/m.168144 type:complete len:194 (+) Transcript_80642:295-876(+)